MRYARWERSRLEAGPGVAVSGLALYLERFAAAGELNELKIDDAEIIGYCQVGEAATQINAARD